MKAKPLLKAIAATISTIALFVMVGFILYVCALRFPNAFVFALALALAAFEIYIIFSIFYDKYRD